jgi:uridine kinase
MYIICIIGPVGSGKTSFTERISHALNKKDVEVVSVDNYFLPEQEDYDVPQALNKTLLQSHLELLRSGSSVENAPRYSFENHTCTYDLTLKPCKYIFVEGHMNLCLFTKNDFDLVIYIDQPDETCYQRRLLRDTQIREHRSEYEVSLQHFTKTLPAQKKHVEPQKIHADVIVSNFEQFVVLCYFLCFCKK